MPEEIIKIMEKIEAVKGKEYVRGMVDMANLLAPDREEKKTAQESA